MDGWRPIHAAASNGHFDVVEFLVEQNVDLNLQTNFGFTALDLAVINKHAQIVEFLLQAKVDKTMRNEVGRTALHLACQSGEKEIFEIVQRYCSKSDLHLTDNERYNCLHIAVESGHNEMVKLLMEKKMFPVNSQTSDGSSALYLAAAGGHLDIVKSLTKTYKADVNLPETDGWSPLHIAAQEGYTDIAKELIKAGAKLEAKTDEGYKAAEIATYNGNKDITDTIKKAQGIIDKIYSARPNLAPSSK